MPVAVAAPADDHERAPIWRADAALTRDLAANGLVVTTIRRTEARMYVFTRDAYHLPRVAVVDISPGMHGEAFARLMSKVHAPNGAG